MDQDLRSLLEPLHSAGKIPTVKQFVVMGHVRSTTTLRPFNYYEDLIKAASPLITFREDLNENAGLGLCYTSGTVPDVRSPPRLSSLSAGTTGHPKGVLYSHRSVVLASLVTTTTDTFAVSERDRLLLAVPMFHGASPLTPTHCEHD